MAFPSGDLAIVREEPRHRNVAARAHIGRRSPTVLAGVSSRRAGAGDPRPRRPGPPVRRAERQPELPCDGAHPRVGVAAEEEEIAHRRLVGHERPAEAKGRDDPIDPGLEALDVGGGREAEIVGRDRRARPGAEGGARSYAELGPAHDPRTDGGRAPF
jgi:hypothetical protein